MNEITEPINESLHLTSLRPGLAFGTDAYLLSAYLRPRRGGKAVDLGAGTGVISLLCASRGQFSSFVCVERQDVYCSLISRNAEENNLSDKITVLHEDVRELSPSSLGFEADAVFSNPPYLRAGAGFANEAEEKDAARHETAGGIADFCQAAARLLRFGGYFTVVYRPDRMSELLCAMTAAGLEPKRMTTVYASEHHAPCLILAEAKKGASPGMFVTRPLLLTEGGTESADTHAIYENGAFPAYYFAP